jgi:hypothetical protein
MLADIMSLFRSRRDAYAVQLPSGGYAAVREPLTPEVIQEHLEGTKTVAVYPVVDGRLCGFLALDLDTPEPVRELYQRTVEEVGEKAVLVERTRRGYHIWVFFQSLVPASLARGLGKKIAGDQVEIYPKQSRVPVEGLGNPIRLPLGLHLAWGRRTYFVSPLDFETEIAGTDALESVVPLNPREIEAEPEEGEAPEATANPGWLVGDFPCWSRLLSLRVPEGRRHSAAWALACHLRDRGIPAEEAREILRAWWGRLPQPPEANTVYPWRDAMRCLAYAYRKPYSVGCRNIREVFPELCDPSCPVRCLILDGR